MLLFTLLLAEFAEALAEGRGKAQADSLLKTEKELSAKLLSKDGSITEVLGTELRRGDLVLVKMGSLFLGTARS